MNIIIINGSARKNGATATLLHEVQRELMKKDDVEVHYVDLSQQDLALCIGCIRCYATGRCALPDDGETLAEQVKRADGIVIGSPTYGSNVPGCLKNFMDRGHFLVDQSLHNKYGFIVTTYEIADGPVVRDALRKFFAVSGAMVRGDFLLKLDFNTDPWAHETTRPRLHRQIERFYQAIRRQEHKTLFERIFSHVLVQIIWKPIFLGQAKKYAAVLDSWRQKGILTTEKTSVLSPLIRALL